MAVEKPTPCYICWFFTISLAIVTGTLLTDALRAGITYLSFDKYSNSIIQSSDSEDSSVNKAAEPKNELPIVKLSPKTDIPSAKLSPEQEQSNKDIFIKVLPDKGIPKEKSLDIKLLFKHANTGLRNMRKRLLEKMPHTRKPHVKDWRVMNRDQYNI